MDGRDLPWRAEGDLQNQEGPGNWQDGKLRCYLIPEVFYPAAEADKLLKMIHPIQWEARRPVKKNSGEHAIFEWFLRSFQLCYQNTNSRKHQI
jgi:hypothetical protein